jgi:hypothetical protein
LKATFSNRKQPQGIFTSLPTHTYSGEKANKSDPEAQRENFGIRKTPQYCQAHGFIKDQNKKSS